MNLDKNIKNKYINSANIIKSFLRYCLLIKNDNFIIKLISKNVIKNNTEHNRLFIKCLKILKKYNPAKNEYKFIYGGLIQKSVIDFLNNIFYSCIDLDELHTHGSEYKIDCKLNITEHLSKNFSIKAKKNCKGDIIIINKLNNDKQYNLDDLITIIIIIELKDIIIIPHKKIPHKFIKNNNANIAYKSSLFKYLYDSQEYIIHLTEFNQEYNTFIKDIYPNIKLHNIYEELYNKL